MKTESRTILDYWFVLYDRRLSLLLVLLATLAVTAGLSLVIRPVYEAQVSFYVPADDETPSYFAPDAVKSMRRTVLAPIYNDAEYAGYLGILKSQALAQRIVERFPHKTVKSLLRKDTDFEVTPEYLIALYARDHDAATAAALANAYVEEFDRLMQDYSRRRTEQTIASLERQLAATERALEKAEQGLVAIKQREGVVSLDDEIQQLVRQKVDFETQRQQAEVALAGKRREFQALETRLREEGRLLDEQALLVVDSRVQGLQDRLWALEDQRIALTVELGDQHPEVVALDRQAARVRAEMAEQARRVMSGQIKGEGTFYEDLRQQLAQLFAERRSVEATLAAYDHVLGGLRDRHRRLAALQQEIEAAEHARDEYRSRRNALRTELHEARAQRDQPVPAVIQVDVADPPPSPIFPILWLNLLVGTVLGLVAGVFYAFLMDFLANTRRTRLLRMIRAVRATDGEPGVAHGQ